MTRGKKEMKKTRIVKLLLVAIVMITTLVGCNSGDSEKDGAMEVLKAAMDKTNAATSSSGSITMDYEFDMKDSETENMSMIIDFIVNNANDDATLEMMTAIVLETSEGDQSMSIYAKDGYYYMDTFGMKIKVSASEGEEYLDVSNQISLQDISDNQVITAKMKESGGDKIITLELKEDTVKEMILDTLEQLYSGVFTEDDLVVENYNIEYTIAEDGYIYDQIIEFKIAFSMDGEEMSMNVKTCVVYESFEETEITFPDFSEYVEY